MTTISSVAPLALRQQVETARKAFETATPETRETARVAYSRALYAVYVDNTRRGAEAAQAIAAKLGHQL